LCSARAGEAAVLVHPLARVLTDAVDGTFPRADGGWRRVPPWRDGVEAVLAFTGHAVLAVAPDVPDDRLVALGVDGYGGAHHPRVLLELAGPDGWIDSLDAVLGRRSTGDVPTELVERPDLLGHPRVRFASAVRDQVRVYGRPDEASTTLATVSRGIGGLFEISAELDEHERGRGSGADLVGQAVAAVPAGEVVIAAVAPGNSASLRAFLRAGFSPLASVQLLRPARQS
jgi:hypothetical protein